MLQEGIKENSSATGEDAYIVTPFLESHRQVPDMDLGTAQLIGTGYNKGYLNRLPTSPAFEYL